MEYFQNKKSIFIALTALAVIGFGVNSFFNVANHDSNNNVSEASVSASKLNASQAERLNLAKRSETKTRDKDTDNTRRPSIRREDGVQTDASTLSRAEALAREEELAKTQQCLESNVAEVGYITEAYNQNTLDADSARQQIIYYMESCGRQQVASMIEKIFSDSDNVVHAMALLLKMLPNMDSSFSIINAIKQQDFSHEDMVQLIAMTEDQPTGIKQALVPSIIRSDNLDDFVLLTQQDNFFNSVEDRTGSYPSADEADNMVQNMIMSARHSIQPDGEIYNHIINNHPNSTTYNQLIKIALSPN